MKNRLYAVTTLMLALFTVEALADSATINFSGNLIHGACTISVDSEDQTVDFGTVETKGLYADGQSAAQLFAVRLVDCNPDVARKASITFAGTEDGTLAGFVATAGEAKGIAIGINDIKNNLIAINTASPMFPLKSGNMIVPFQAYVKAYPRAIIEKSITEGTFSSVVTFSVNYE